MPQWQLKSILFSHTTASIIRQKTKILYYRDCEQNYYIQSYRILINCKNI